MDGPLNSENFVSTASVVSPKFPQKSPMLLARPFLADVFGITT
jgi:hypothetical protein